MKEQTRFKMTGLRWALAVGAVLLGFVARFTVSETSSDGGGALNASPRAMGTADDSTHRTTSRDKGNFVRDTDRPLKATEAPESELLVLQKALAIEDLLERRQSLEQLGLHWAAADVGTAIAALNQMRNDTDRQAFVRGIAYFLSKQDPRFALERISKLTDTDDRIAARRELLAAWAPMFAGDSERNAWLLYRYGPGGLGMQLLRTAPPQTELAVLWAQALEPGEGKAKMLSDIAGMMARKSPAEAWKLGDGLQGDDYRHFLGSFSDGWAAVDGQAALEWSTQITDPVLRANLQESINSTWSIFDLEGAKAHLLTLPSGSARDSLLSAIVSRMASMQTTEAFTWIRDLPTPEDQGLATRTLQNVAPVGIGVTLAMRDGLPIITGLVPGASASLSQQINVQDRIIGVDTDNGAGFVSTYGMDLDRVVDFIRGRQGTSVRLQVVKANTYGFDPPRVVVLPRMQVLKTPRE